MSTGPVAPGQILDGKYRIEHVIGTGGMGIVVAAKHLELGQLVAMKFLLAEGLAVPEVSVRFIREARAVARLRSEHVARVIDVGRLASGSPYIVMEYLEGGDLDDLLKRGQLSVEDATDYVIQACDAMAEAHRLGIIHRDLKPANLFLTRQVDGSPIVKVLDFGISKSVFETGSGALTSAGALVGSPLYMSPEQMRSAKDVDLRTDIWSLGAVLFELLAGRPPFEADSITGIIAAIMHMPPASLSELRPDLPEGLVQAVMRCLEKDVTLRFQDVSELVHAITPFAPPSAQTSADRVHRIIGGSIPPPRIGSSLPPHSSSLLPPSLTPRSDAPISLPPPPGLGSMAKAAAIEGAATALGQGTAGAWTGTGEPPRKSSRSGVIVAAVGLGGALLAVAGYALVTGKQPAAVSSEASSAQPVASVIQASEPVAPTPPVITPSVSPSAVASSAAVASAAPSGAASVAAPTTNAPGKVWRKVPSSASAESRPSEPEQPRAPGLSMKLK